MSSSLFTRLFTFAVLILLGWTLSLVYGFLSRSLTPGWIFIGLLHSVLALGLWRCGKGLRVLPRWGLQAYLPAAALVLGCFAVALFSRTVIDGAPPLAGALDPSFLGLVLWIPVVEELVFRYGIGGWARARLGIFWGAYGSALVFAMAHGSGNQLSAPLGPLLLALACEGLYGASGRITAAMAFHAACNASGWIFAAIDARWLDWLEALYLKV